MTLASEHLHRQRPIGVFDSGVGGLSVLRALHSALPAERFVYLADSANAPYGERGDAYVRARTHAITQYLRERHHIKALVVACNTATAAAIHELRSSHLDFPVVGLEPAIKPAMAATRTGHVGVIGTRGTLGSAKFQRLLTSLEGPARFVVQPCDGLAHAIERSVAMPSPMGNMTETGALCAHYMEAMGAFGTAPGQIDTLVLGCTHYVFVAHELRALVGPDVRFIETGVPVARQTHRLLHSAGLLHTPVQEALAVADDRPWAPGTEGPGTRLLTTGPVEMLQAAAHQWLALPADSCEMVSVPG